MSLETILKSIGVLLIFLSLLYYLFIFFLLPMLANTGVSEDVAVNDPWFFFDLPSAVTFLGGCILVFIARYIRKKNN